MACFSSVFGVVGESVLDLQRLVEDKLNLPGNFGLVLTPLALTDVVRMSKGVSMRKH